MKTKKIKPYAITVSIKPKPDGISRYRSVTYKGMVLATSPSEAKEKTIDFFLSQIKVKILTRDDFTIKKCEVHNDFLVNSIPE